MNNWQRAGLGIIFFGIVSIIITVFPSIFPGADSAIGPVQFFAIMLGFAVVGVGVEIFTFVTKFDDFKKYFRQPKRAYIFWLGSPILYYIASHLSPLQYFYPKAVLLLKWVSGSFAIYGFLSFFKIKLASNSYKKNNQDLLGLLKITFSRYLPNILICASYGIIGIALLSPLAANTILPQAPDFANHTAIIIQAKMALDEGQFPILVAPWQFSGWRLPLFQFYSPLPYRYVSMI